jgi:hippurate hydrolase
MRLHAIVSREVPATETAVLTVGAIHAGTAANIIAPEAELLITTRAFSSGVRQRVHEAMHRVLEAEAAASGAPVSPKVEVTGSYPVLVNDADATARTMAAIGAALGMERLQEQPLIMGAEDFGAYGTAAGVPSCFWFVGGTDPVVFAAAEEAGRLDQDVPSNHSPFFAPVIEPTLSTGLAAMVAAAREWLD